MTVAFYGRKVSGIPENFSIIVLPDTQRYSQYYPWIFSAQTQWIVDNLRALNIAYVAHVGDVVENPEVDVEWDRAVEAMQLLEDPLTTSLPDGIPYGIARGNHDAHNPFNEHFGVTRFQGRSYYGGGYPAGDNDNSYSLFSTASMDFIVIHIYSKITNIASLSWAEGLLKNNPSRRGIVVAHNILTESGSFGTWGELMYQNLKDNPNLFLMLCGHARGEKKKMETYNGNKIYTLMSNYEHRVNGGDGWLRILKFSPGEDKISVQTFSPIRNGGLGDFETDSNSQFELYYDMEESAPFEEFGRVSEVTGDMVASIPWSGLWPSKMYEWYVTVSDGAGTITSPTWSFTTEAFEHQVFLSLVTR
jgi:hypothetical protein